MTRIVLIAGILFVFVPWVAFAEEHTQESLQEIKKQVDAKKAVLVDVRDKQEWDKGHVATRK